jgi:hypothetical protein
MRGDDVVDGVARRGVARRRRARSRGRSSTTPRRLRIAGAARQCTHASTHALATHAVEQQSAFVEHDAPTSLHAAIATPHVAGAPPHRAVQQSAADAHEVPSAMHGAVHERTPFEAGPQVPRQQSVSCAHGVPFARHGPGPKSQRLFCVSQAAQHAVPPPELQSSPVARQLATESSAHF